MRARLVGFRCHVGDLARTLSLDSDVALGPHTWSAGVAPEAARPGAVRPGARERAWQLAQANLRRIARWARPGSRRPTSSRWSMMGSHRGMTALGSAPWPWRSAARPTSAASTGRRCRPRRRPARNSSRCVGARSRSPVSPILSGGERAGIHHHDAGSRRSPRRYAITSRRRVPPPGRPATGALHPVAIALPRRAQTRSRTGAARRLRRERSDASLTSSSTAVLT